jgi:hypothetical protein
MRRQAHLNNIVRFPTFRWGCSFYSQPSKLGLCSLLYSFLPLSFALSDISLSFFLWHIYSRIGQAQRLGGLRDELSYVNRLFHLFFFFFFLWAPSIPTYRVKTIFIRQPSHYKLPTGGLVKFSIYPKTISKRLFRLLNFSEAGFK